MDELMRFLDKQVFVQGGKVSFVRAPDGAHNEAEWGRRFPSTIRMGHRSLNHPYVESMREHFKARPA